MVLTSVTVRPATQTVPLGGSAFYWATGTFSDCSTADVTNVAAWSVTPATVAVGSAPGGVRSVGIGAATVTP